MTSHPDSRGKAPMIASSDEEQVPVYTPTYYPGCTAVLPSSPPRAPAPTTVVDAPSEASPEQAIAVVPAPLDIAGPSTGPAARQDPPVGTILWSHPCLRVTARKAVNTRAQVVHFRAPRPSDYEATDPTDPEERSDSSVRRRSPSPPRRQLGSPRQPSSQMGSHSVSMPAPLPASPPAIPPVAPQDFIPVPLPDRLLFHMQRRVRTVQARLSECHAIMARRATSYRRSQRLLDRWRSSYYDLSMVMTDLHSEFMLAVNRLCRLPGPTEADKDRLMAELVERVEEANSHAQRMAEELERQELD